MLIRELNISSFHVSSGSFFALRPPSPEHSNLLAREGIEDGDRSTVCSC